MEFVKLPLAAILFCLLAQAHSAKIAVLIFPAGGSHFFMMKPIGQQLEARGHKVTYLLCTLSPLSEKLQVKSKLLYHTPQYPKDYFVQVTVHKSVKYGSIGITGFKIVGEILKGVCDALLTNQEILEQLKGYDMVFADNSLFGCGNLLKEKANIPYIVDFSCWGFNDVYNWQYGVIWPVSYVPADPIHMTKEGIPFIWRVLNTLAYLMFNFFPLLLSPSHSLKIEHSITPDKTFPQLVSETDLVLIPVDWALEYPRPVPPNAKVIGATTTQPSKKLPEDLEKFMQSASDGVVLVSYGSMASILDDKRSSILAKAFSMLKYKVLWKYAKSFPDVKNIKTVTWMPQNDILGHPNLKLFMSHGGLNSVYESTYHGVPMLLTPLWGDQIGYAAKIKLAGFGESVDIKMGVNFTAEMIVNLINKILDDPRYKTNAVRASKLLQDRQRTPAEEGADWIEYVLRNNGTHHLRPFSTQLPFYQYFLVDVIFFYIVVIFIILFIICKICKCIKYCCCSRKSKEKVN